MQAKGSYGSIKSYVPAKGSPRFRQAMKDLVFGADREYMKGKEIITVETLSGTGALSIGFGFIRKYLPRLIYVSEPTWVIHLPVLKDNHLQFKYYPYYNPSTKGLEVEKMIEFFEQADEGSIVLLQACAHNPTGVDPDREEWKKIVEAMKKKKLIPFIDLAYQGLATRDLDKDVWLIRHFAEEGFELFVAQSLAKNFGLYGERIGALHIVAR